VLWGNNGDPGNEAKAWNQEEGPDEKKRKGQSASHKHSVASRKNKKKNRGIVRVHKGQQEFTL